jgi:carbon-monoxide dehydrogenase medium subunit
LVGVFVAKTSAGIRVAVTGAAPSVFRAKTIESALSEKFSTDVLTNFRVPSDGLNSDLHGDADFRAHLISVLAKRAVARILAAGGVR